MQQGTVLFTKDGRRIGNAIILRQLENRYGDDPLYLIQTDFGNRTQMIEAEILDLFYVGPVQDLKTRWDNLIKTREEHAHLEKLHEFENSETEPDREESPSGTWRPVSDVRRLKAIGDPDHTD